MQVDQFACTVDSFLKKAIETNSSYADKPLREIQKFAENNGDVSQQQLSNCMNALGEIAFYPEFAQEVAWEFRQIHLELLCRGIRTISTQSVEPNFQSCIERAIDSMGMLLRLPFSNLDRVNAALLLLREFPTPFSAVLAHDLENEQCLETISRWRRLAIAGETFARVLSQYTSPDQLRKCCDWNPLLRLLNSNDLQTQQSAGRLFILLENLDQVIGDTLVSTTTSSKSTSSPRKLMNTAVELIEWENRQLLDSDTMASSAGNMDDPEAISRLIVPTQYQTNICGIAVSNTPNPFHLDEKLTDPEEHAASSVIRDTRGPASDHSFVYTSTARENLRQVALGLQQNRPILLEGVAGSGKTSTIREIAAILSKPDEHLVELQIDDQMDSKTLLGTYVCTDSPGEFKWQPGALTQAVLHGYWVLIEDIDRVPFEIIAALSPLFESNKLLLPNRNQELVAAPGFQLFATRTTASITSSSPVIDDDEVTQQDPDSQRKPSGVTVSRFAGPSATVLRNLWTRVGIEPLTTLELAKVAAVRYSSLPSDIVSRVLDTFTWIMDESTFSPTNVAKISQTITAFGSLRRAVPGRSFSSRDLFKWLDRVYHVTNLHKTARNASGIYTESERLGVLVEAMDTFASGMPNRHHRFTFATCLALRWEISVESLTSKLSTDLPQLTLPSTPHGEPKVGRANVKVNSSSSLSTTAIANSIPKFAETGPTLRILEQLAVAVLLNEPVLLVGETGVGKTAMVQHLAAMGKRRLLVQNMHIQSDTTELLGGYKPVEMSQIARPLYAQFVNLFTKTFSKDANGKFLLDLEKSYEAGKWKKLSRGFKQAIRIARHKQERQASKASNVNSGSNKRAKDSSSESSNSVSTDFSQWDEFEEKSKKFERQRAQVETHFAFDFVEGALVQAVRNGDWVLLDEINLASSETLERLASLLDGVDGTVSLTERGDVTKVTRHPDFRLLAAMNPASDFGKKDMPPALRNRFTEMYVDEVTDPTDLALVVGQYFQDIPDAPIDSVVHVYLEARRLSETVLSDGGKQAPKYSLRTLCRALSSCRQFLLKGFGVSRALYEGFTMTFVTLLEPQSSKLLHQVVKKAFVSEIPKKQLDAPTRRPGNSRDKSAAKQFTLVEHYWLQTGPEEPFVDNKYVLTPTVTEYIRSLSRAIAAEKYPVLLQGPTSSGKTSMVGYLAARTGHRCVRINNHEHTDLQEYMGSYVSNDQGKLTFQEGVLVEAVRKGHWIVLDELNLAPSEVLEALNRLLDDNRELFIPETQETIRPHPHFMLFATQNPPGTYGGRKVLSKAFRNRFLELHIDEIPTDELEIILQQRCKLAPPFCKVLVKVMKELQMVRQQSRVFAGKDGYITPRDLLRWGQRNPQTYQALAEEGYRLLGERVRVDKEKETVRKVIEKHCKCKLDETELYGYSTLLNGSSSSDAPVTSEALAREAGLGRIVWTKSMCRLYTLIGRCIENKEPVLLVGETGCGKTTVCQLHAINSGHVLDILNCHQNTETADILGSLRPIRNRERLVAEIRSQVCWVLSNVPKELANQVVSVGNDQESLMTHASGSSLSTLIGWVQQVLKLTSHSEIAHLDDKLATQVSEKAELIMALYRQQQGLFEWQDGPLVNAMRQGHYMLLDELSLAEDAVIERLNSVLEPSRTLVLAERGGATVEEIVAHDEFRIVATMNPGGDFGKRELSPALRNRFTEIWIPAIVDPVDQNAIVQDFFETSTKLKSKQFATKLVEFVQWFNKQGTARNGSSNGIGTLSLRDLLSWASFMKETVENDVLNPWESYVHGAGLVVLDGLGLGTGASPEMTKAMRDAAYTFLFDQVPADVRADTMRSCEPGTRNNNGNTVNHNDVEMVKKDMFGSSPFYIPFGNETRPEKLAYSLNAPTTSKNLMRVLRAMQLKRPILLEGSPGVGKTSLITALAAASGHKLVRINLSEQTDFADLMGSDLPMPVTEDGNADGGARFAWSDGVFLSALQAGDWVLLDELNLAPQSVLEGLNACLDHRATVYIPELDRSFKCPPSFRVFAAQNPLQQGGGRKGLPKSFLNRFTKVFVDSLDQRDLLYITMNAHPTLSQVQEVGPKHPAVASLKRQPTVMKDKMLQLMIQFNEDVVVDTMTHPRYARKGSPWEFNLRDISRWCTLMETEQSSITGHDPSAYFELLYSGRLRTLADRLEITKSYEKFFGENSSSRAESFPSIHLEPETVSIGFATLQRGVSSGSSLVPTSGTGKLPAALARSAMNVAKCIEQGWPTLLVGPSGSGKTTVLRYLAALSNRKLYEFGMTSSTDSTELLGCFEQSDLSRTVAKYLGRVDEFLSATIHACCQSESRMMELDDQTEFQSLTNEILLPLEQARYSLAKKIGNIDGDTVEYPVTIVGTCLAVARSSLDMTRVRLSQQDVTTSQVDGLFQRLQILEGRHATFEHDWEMIQRERGLFEWVDGSLLQAMEDGDWVVLDNANLCNPTVLDRLNPVMEPNGELLINECGTVDGGKPRIIRPHRDFRVFLVMDPLHGEVSRAMRNRCVELAFLDPVKPTTTLAIEEKLQVDEHSIVWNPNTLSNLDAVHALVANGVVTPSVVRTMIQVHSETHSACTKIGMSSGDLPGTRNLLRWASGFQSLLSSGENLSVALCKSFAIVYSFHTGSSFQATELVQKVWNENQQATVNHEAKEDAELCSNGNTVVPFLAGLPSSTMPVALFDVHRRQFEYSVSLFWYSLVNHAKIDTMDVVSSRQTALHSATFEMLSGYDQMLTQHAGHTGLLLHSLIRMVSLQPLSSIHEQSSLLIWIKSIPQLLEAANIKVEGAEDFVRFTVTCIEGLFSALSLTDTFQTLTSARMNLIRIAEQNGESALSNLKWDPVGVTQSRPVRVSRILKFGQLLRDPKEALDLLSHHDFVTQLAGSLLKLQIHTKALEWHLATRLRDVSSEETNQSKASALLVSYAQGLGKPMDSELMDNPLTILLWPMFTQLSNAYVVALETVTKSTKNVDSSLTALFVQEIDETHAVYLHLVELADSAMYENDLEQSKWAVYCRWLCKSLVRIQSQVDKVVPGNDIGNHKDIRSALVVFDQINLRTGSNFSDMLALLKDDSSKSNEFKVARTANKSLLWKNGGHPSALKTKELLTSFQHFIDVVEEHSQTVSGSMSRKVLVDAIRDGDPLLYLNAALKQELLQMWCTLFWANHSVRVGDASSVPDFGRMLEVWTASVDAAKEKLMSHEAKSDDSEVIITQLVKAPEKSRWCHVQLFPMFDNLTAQRECLLLQDILSLPVLFGQSNVDEEQQTTLLNQIETKLQNFIHLALEQSSRSVHELVVYQHVLWTIQGVTTGKLSFASLGEHISNARDTLVRRWHESSWTSAENADVVSDGDMEGTQFQVSFELSPSPKYQSESGENESHFLPLTHDLVGLRCGSGIVQQGSIRAFQVSMTNHILRLLHGTGIGVAQARRTVLPKALHAGPIALVDRAAKVNQLRDIVVALCRTERQNTIQRLQSEQHIQWALLTQVFGCFLQATIVDQEAFSKLSSKLSTMAAISSDAKERFDAANSLIESFVSNESGNDARFLKCIETALRPCVTALTYDLDTDSSHNLELEVATEQTISKLKSSAQGWIQLGLLRLDLLVPLIAVDPAQKSTYQHYRAKHKISRKVLEMAGLVLGEKLNGCFPDNQVVEMKSNGLEELHTRCNDLAEKMVFRSQDVGYGDLHREFTEFFFGEGFCSRSRVETLVIELSDGSAIDQALAKEAMWQAASKQFLSSISSTYWSFSDIIDPILASVGHVKHGLRLLRSAAEYSRDVSVTAISAAVRGSLLRFPVCDIGGVSGGSANLLGSQQAQRWVSKFAGILGGSKGIAASSTQLVVASLSRAKLQVLDTPEGLNHETLDTLTRVFNGFVHQWNEERREAKAKAEIEAQSVMYKTKSHDVETPEVREENEFREMFPDFFASFADIEELHGNQEGKDFEIDTPSASNAQALESDNSNDPTELLLTCTDEKIIRQVVDSFLRVVSETLEREQSNDNPAKLMASDEDRMEVFSQSFHAASHFALSPSDLQVAYGDVGAPIGGSLLALSSALLDCCRTPTANGVGAMATQVEDEQNEDADDSTFEDEKALLESVETPEETFSAYHHSCVEELSLLSRPLSSFQSRITELRKLWPDNAVLLQLAVLVEKLFALPIDAPLMKALVGVESLLKKGHDWEVSAHKGVSIAPQLSQLNQLIMRWRRIEVRSWKSLLGQRQINCEADAKKWWLNMYQLVVVGLEQYKNNDIVHGDGSILSTADSKWLFESKEEVELLNIAKVSNKENSVQTKGKVESFEVGLFATMEQYTRTATIGDFNIRLKILRSLGNYAKRLGMINSSFPAYNERALYTGNLLLGLARYYEQWVADVARSQKALGQPMEKQLRDHAKLAKWDDQTYFALKESSERSHRKLHKITRDFDEVLNMPIQSTITRSIDQCITTNPIVHPPPKIDEDDEDAEPKKRPTDTLMVVSDLIPKVKSVSFVDCKLDEVNDSSIQVEAFDKLQFVPRVGVLGKRLTSHLRKRILPFLNGSFDEATSAPDEINQSIMSRIQHLQRGIGPQSAKHRAFVDLLKTFKAHKLSRYSASIPSNLRDTQSMLSLPSVGGEVERAIQAIGDENPAVLKEWTASDRAFFRCLAQLQQFRQTTLTSYSAEVSQTEVRQCLGFAEQFVLNMAQQRSVLSSVSVELKSLTQVRECLKCYSTENLVLFSSVKSLHEIWESLVGLRGCLLSTFTGVQELRILEEKLASALRTSGKWSDPQDNIPATSLATTSTLSALERNRGKVKGFVTKLIEITSQLKVEFESVVGGTQQLGSTNQRLLFVKDVKVLESVRQQLENVADLLCEFQQETKEYFPADAIEPLCGIVNKALGITKEVLSLQTDNNEAKGTKEGMESIATSMDMLLENVLLGTQGMLSNSTRDTTTLSTDEDDDSVMIQHFHNQGVVNFANKLRLCEIVSSGKEVLKSMEAAYGHGPEQASTFGLLETLKNIQMMCDNYAKVVGVWFRKVIRFNFEMSRLGFLALRVFRTVCAHGFCRPPPQDDDENGGSQDDGDMEGEGTGMGEGEGREDVTDQLDNEEQILGLQGDEHQEKDTGGEEKGDDGMEMENDFEGDMYDVEKEDNNNKEEKDEEEDETELDREMGDIEDDKQDVVDEKLWGDDSEDEEEDPSQDEKFENDAPMKGESLEDETHTKEDGADENKQDEKQEENGKKEESKENTDENDEDQGEINEEDVEDKNLNVPQPTQNDDVEDLELPDDMEIDEDQQDDGQGENDEEEGENAEEGDTKEGGDNNAGDEEAAVEETVDGDDDEVNKDEDDDGQEQENDENIEDENQINEQDEEDDQVPSGGGQAQEEGPDEEQEQDENMERDDTLPEVAAEPESNAVEQAIEEDGNPEMKANSFGANPSTSEQTQDDKQAPDAQVATKAEESENPNETQENEEDRQDQPKGTQRGDTEESNTGEWQNSRNPVEDNNDSQPSSQNRPKPNPDAPNPWKSPGDAKKHWNRRLKMEEVEDQVDENGDRDDGEADDAKMNDSNENEEEPKGTFDYSGKKDESTTQVLGPNTQENAEIPDMNELPEDEETGQDEPDEAQEAENENGTQEAKNDADDTADKDVENANENSNPKKRKKASTLMDDPREQKLARDEGEEEAQDMEIEQSEDGNEHYDEREEIVTNRAVAEYKDPLLENEMQIVSSQNDLLHVGDEITEEAFARWGAVANETSDMSQRLCEQLRLLLEPTMATKLRGDYRTGKRINMRKIIPFIASQYKKDKIWLRRTKPSKRQYQIVLAIDDSKSMLPAGDLALKALATISKAMTKLEVGEVAVARFGKTAEFLHDLNQPFTDTSGAYVMSHFTFAQEHTSIEKGLERVLQRLSDAKQSSGGSVGTKIEYRQLVFFITDGRFDSDLRERVKRLIRIALQQKQLLVLLIVEHPDQESILNTRQATYVNGKLKIVNYLEDYPFPYYIVLSSMQTLPETVADALRQWFELLSTSSD